MADILFGLGFGMRVGPAGFGILDLEDEAKG
jgi:hypothetical protein